MNKNPNVIPIQKPSSSPHIHLINKSKIYNKKPFWLSFGLILLLFLGFLAIGVWFWYGQLEESVPGSGQVIPEGRIRRIMSPINGEVTKLYVQENQKVKAGQPLMELDPKLTQIEQSGVLEQLSLFKQESNALKLALLNRNGRLLTGNSVQSAWVNATRQTFQSQMDAANMQISKTSYQYKGAVEKYNQVNNTLSSGEKMLKQYEELYKEGGLPEKDLKEYEQRVMAQRGEFAALGHEIEARKIEYEQAKQQPKEIIGTYQKELLSKLIDYQKNIAQLHTDIEKTNFAGKYHIIKAPMDGIINEQVIHGAGETVTAGETLISLVPVNSKFIIETRVLNMDMAFIHLGQRVSLRLDALPYQHFGKLYGTVISISPSTVQDKEGKPYYLVRIKPEKTSLKEFTGKTYSIFSGMTVSVDFITRKKNIFRFFSDPIQYHFDRAFRDPTTR
ncbi:MAG: HlyD family type I secretion periplasmic adaptor subunit [Candidatus Gastranaerophilales bacterium]|nr:HlyD family type I secretion periplasmic adaptor subunit [Candidatus Gastranaerophilales bacterium]